MSLAAASSIIPRGAPVTDTCKIDISAQIEGCLSTGGVEIIIGNKPYHVDYEADYVCITPTPEGEGDYGKPGHGKGEEKKHEDKYPEQPKKDDKKGGEYPEEVEAEYPEGHEVEYPVIPEAEYPEHKGGKKDEKKSGEYPEKVEAEYPEEHEAYPVPPKDDKPEDTYAAPPKDDKKRDEKYPEEYADGHKDEYKEDKHDDKYPEQPKHDDKHDDKYPEQPKKDGKDGKGGKDGNDKNTPLPSPDICRQPTLSLNLLDLVDLDLFTDDDITLLADILGIDLSLVLGGSLGDTLSELLENVGSTLGDLLNGLLGGGNNNNNNNNNGNNDKDFDRDFDVQCGKVINDNADKTTANDVRDCLARCEAEALQLTLDVADGTVFDCAGVSFTRGISVDNCLFITGDKVLDLSLNLGNSDNTDSIISL